MSRLISIAFVIGLGGLASTASAQTTVSIEDTIDAPSGSYWFGIEVDISGNRLIVGALDEAYFYERNGSDWESKGSVTESGAGITAVSILGATAVVGQPFYDTDSVTNSGRVLVFRWNNTTDSWDQKAIIEPPTPTAQGRFGTSVDLDTQHRLAIGSDSSEAFIFEESPVDVWTEELSVTRTELTFGVEVSLEDDVFVVAAPFSNEDPIGLTGDVFIYDDAGVLQQHLDASVYGIFGISVGLQGDSLLVGAPYEDGGGVHYLYKYNTSTDVWDLDETDDGPLTNDMHGYAVALDDAERPVVGRPHQPDIPFVIENNDGEVVFYDATDPSTVDQVEDETCGGAYGRSISGNRGRWAIGSVRDVSTAGCVVIYEED